jgi:two-component system, chemotaxis family, response regulator Rcp1
VKPEFEVGRPAEILLVEDNEHDVVLTRESFQREKFLVNISHVDNGEECMDFLRKLGKYRDCKTPDLILLDLNLPVMDGREVLTEIHADDSLRHIPVVVLTTSATEADILEMYQLGCCSYIVKPVDFEQFQKVIGKFGNYWFTVVVLPVRHGD